jgi:demethylmenaquinone methyltransferase / 2-methoxy-6-polyprenyl-1,4-benzoquinol methylase
MISWSARFPRDSSARLRYLDSIFGSIAPRYDLVSRLLSLGQDLRWKARAFRALPRLSPEDRVLDLATGSAAVPLLLQRARFRGTIVGLDRSAPMLAEGRSRWPRPGGSTFVRGDLATLPFVDGSFDAVTMSYALRYASDTPGVLREVYRVLKPGGSFVCLDFGVPRSRLYRMLCMGYLLAFGTLWGLVLHGRPGAYWHIVESLAVHPGQRAVVESMGDAGLEDVTLLEEAGGISILATGRRARHPKS